MNLPAALSAIAVKVAAKPAILFGEQQVTYGQILAQAGALAEYLQTEAAVRLGDRVGLWLKNCPEFVPALFGILSAGGVVVPINSFLKPNEVAYILDDAGINLLISDQSMGEQIAILQASRPGTKVWHVEDFCSLPASSSSLSAAGQRESDLALIIYTSGTTGHPKGAMLSHGNLLSNVESCRQVLAAFDGDRFAVVLPMFHSFMFWWGDRSC